MLNAITKWWTYQRERFPVFGHGPLILAFSLSAVTYSRLLRGELTLPEWPRWAVAFITAFLFFLQLRIADEFKDLDEDTRWRPYRPVPRGLIKLRELFWVFVIAAVIQLALAIALYWPLVVILGIAWLYLAGMSKEFFIREWITRRPITYLWSHMLIMPLIDLYATSCDWLVEGADKPPTSLAWFLVVSFFNGVLIELGRKIRAPEAEEQGVRTYTVLWGIPRATIAWAGVLTANLVAALLAAYQVGAAVPVACALAIPYLLAFAAAVLFMRGRTPSQAKRIELASGLWTLAMYLILGPLSLLYLAEIAPKP